MIKVAATEFSRNFGRYQRVVQREIVEVCSHDLLIRLHRLHIHAHALQVGAHGLLLGSQRFLLAAQIFLFDPRFTQGQLDS